LVGTKQKLEQNDKDCWSQQHGQAKAFLCGASRPFDSGRGVDVRLPVLGVVVAVVPLQVVVVVGLVARGVQPVRVEWVRAEVDFINQFRPEFTNKGLITSL
jgi:hypothetical protein